MSIDLLTTGEALGGRLFPYSRVQNLAGGFEVTSVISACAELNGWYPLGNDWMSSPEKIAAGWNLAEICRMAITSNRQGTHQMNQASLAGVGRRSLMVSSRLSEEMSSNESSGARWTMRELLNQFPYQTEPVAEVMRTIQILMYTEATRPGRVIRENWDVNILGATLMDYLSTILMIRLVGLQFGNRIGMSSFDLSDADGKPPMDIEVARQIFLRSLAATPQELRTLDAEIPAVSDDEGPQYRYNSLRRRPYVKVGADTWTSPVNALSMMKATTSAIFHEVPRRQMQDFGSDLGNLFEQYIGDQLRLISAGIVEGEKKFTPPSGTESLTVDWTVVLPNVTVLIEVKARRPVASMTSGSALAIDGLREKLNEGLGQLKTAHTQWRNGQQQYSHIPATNPVVGLLVTLEDFHLNDLPVLRGHLADPGFPVSIISARELEQLTSMPTRHLIRGLVQLERAAVNNVLNIHSLLDQQPTRANKLLRQTARKSGWMFSSLFDATY